MPHCTILLRRWKSEERKGKKYISITINVDDGEGDEKLFFMFARRNACRYKYLISFFMLFKKRSVRKGKAFETSMNIKERKAECNINQITAKSNDSEKSPDERME